MHLAVGNIMATATSIQNRLADVGEVVLSKVIGAEEAGACCSDNGKICWCDPSICAIYIGPGWTIARAYDCTCYCGNQVSDCENDCHVQV